MIKLGFGTSVLNKLKWEDKVDGIGTYVAELFDQFSNLKKDIEIHRFSVQSDFFKKYPIPEDEVNLGYFKAQVSLSSLTGLSFLGEKALTHHVDLVHATDHYIPRITRKPLVATLMDAIPLSHPEWTSSEFRRIKNYFWRETAQWADKIITISEFSKDQISEHFKISSDKIISIPLGADKKWFKKLSTEHINKVLSKHSITKNFFISVGTIQPRKNLQRVIKAYQSLPERIKKETLLIIVGSRGWGCDELVANLKSGTYGPSVIWLHHLPEDELLALMNSAVALVFPSLFEGFGLPVLEAFASGTAVITSNKTSLPEVAGDAALLVDPEDVNAIAQSMSDIIEDDYLRADMVRRAKARAQDFTWKRTALETIKVYQDVING
jgi:glycosyltransferase involved in cell wall biosynthesis